MFVPQMAAQIVLVVGVAVAVSTQRELQKIRIYRHRYILKMSRYSAVVFIIVPAEGWNHAEGIRN